MQCGISSKPTFKGGARAANTCSTAWVEWMMNRIASLLGGDTIDRNELDRLNTLLVKPGIPIELRSEIGKLNAKFPAAKQQHGRPYEDDEPY